MARDCYKRQQEISQAVLKQNTTTTIEDPPIPHKKHALIEFQQFPTYMKRLLEESDKEKMTADQNQENQGPLTDLPLELSSVDTDPPPFIPTWGTGIYKEEQQDSTWGEITPKTAKHNSPDRNYYRSGICQLCDAPLGSKKRVHGPLTCRECRVLLEEDKEHEKEQEKYNDKRQAVRQARYAAQLAGTTEESKEFTQESQTDYETNENNKESLPKPLMAPNSPPTRSDNGWEYHQNFVRVTLV
jgi:hypothetical protein